MAQTYIPGVGSFSPLGGGAAIQSPSTEIPKKQGLTENAPTYSVAANTEPSSASATGGDQSMLYSAAILGIGAGIANGITSYANANAKATSLRGQAAINESNAGIAELQAQNALWQGTLQIGEVTRKAGQAKSSARAAMAARGLGLGTGTTANVLASSDVNKQIDMINAKKNAVQAALGYRNQAANLRAQAQAQQIMAGAAKSSARMGLVSSLISAAGQVAGMWYMGSRGAV